MSGLLAVHLVWWTRVGLGLVVLAVVLPVLVVTVLAVRSIVVMPRAEGRRWPEGTGWGGLAEPLGVAVTALQTEDVLPPRTDRFAADAGLALAVGTAVGVAATLPLTPRLVVTRPGLGLLLGPALLLSGVAASGWATASVPGLGPLARARLRTRLPGALALVSSAVTVAVQWGTTSLWKVSSLQTTSAVFGVRAFGLPTVLPQAGALAAALVGLHLMGADPPLPWVAEPPGTGLRRAFGAVADTLVLLAGSGWVAVAFLGGGGVPWTPRRSGPVAVLGVLLCTAKVAAVAGALLWARGRRPRLRPADVARLTGLAIALCLLGVVAAAIGRAAL